MARFKFILGLLLAIACTEALGQQPCFGPRCPPPIAIYSWVDVPGHPDEKALVCNGRQVGTWLIGRQQFWAYDGQRHIRQPVTPPIDVPGELRKPLQAGVHMPDWVEHGVDAEHLKSEESYSVSGREVAKADMLNALSQKRTAAGAVDDDSKHTWLLIGGASAAEREEVRRKILESPSLRGIAEKWRIWSGDAAAGTHFLMQDRDTGKPLYPEGNPRIMLLSPDGTVLLSQDSFKGDVTVNALRRLAPERDPKLDPDGLSLPFLPFPSLPFPAIRWDLAAAAGVALLVMVVTFLKGTAVHA